MVPTIFCIKTKCCYAFSLVLFSRFFSHFPQAELKPCTSLSSPLFLVFTWAMRPPAPPNFLLPWLTLAHSSDWAQPSEFSRTSRLRVRSVPQCHFQYLLDLVRDVESQAPPQTHWVRSAFIKDSRRLVCIVIFRITALGVLVHSLHHPQL